jgi:lipoprotein-anchoring transpeptidase ErfK/SrfK
MVLALLAGVCGIVPASAQPMQLPSYPGSYTQPAYPAAPASYAQPQQVRYAYSQPQPNMGGGFIEFLFGGGRPVATPRPYYQQDAQPEAAMPQQAYAQPEPAQVRREIDPRFLKQEVAYHGKEKPGTVVIDTPSKFLYLVGEDGRAMRYGIGVGRPGFTWAGTKTVSMKREWPDWRPPDEMLARRPDLPRYMAGGPDNPLGARAMYLGSSLYRIHGSNEPWTIGQQVSSGCIRMRNEDVIDLYGRVKVGTKVVVI